MSDLISDERFEARRAAMREQLERLGIRHFTADELDSHHAPEWPDRWPENYPMPTGMIANMAETLLLADRIREKWGSPVGVVSGYRNPVYNDVLRHGDNEHTGSEDSQHLYGRALDLQPVNGKIDAFRTHCLRIVKRYRTQGHITGIGFYRSFVHVDCGRYSYHRMWGEEWIE